MRWSAILFFGAALALAGYGLYKMYESVGDIPFYDMRGLGFIGAGIVLALIAVGHCLFDVKVAILMKEELKSERSEIA